MLRVLRLHAVRVVDSGLRLCAQSTMAERAATRRRFYYNIVEVQALQALAASIIHNVTAYIIHVFGLLISAPALLHFGLAFGQLRLATAALALALRRASQREADYPQRTWRHYKANADFRHDFRFDRAHLPRLIRAMRLPETVTFKGYNGPGVGGCPATPSPRSPRLLLQRYMGKRAQPRRVTVFEGDTLWSLAFAYGCGVEDLLRANSGLDQRRRLVAGSTLALPAESNKALPWARLESRPRGGQQLRGSRGNVPVAAVAALLVASLPFAPGSAGDMVRLALGRARRYSQQASGKVLGGVAAVLGAGRRGAVWLLGGVPRTRPDPDVAAESSAVMALRAEMLRARAELAEARAVSAASEARASSLAKELATALASVDAATEAEHTQRQLAQQGVLCVEELSLQLKAVRSACSSPPKA